MIVDDYADIARRLARLKTQQAYSTPQGVHIILSSKYPKGSRSLYAVPPSCALCLWLDEEDTWLMLMPEASTDHFLTPTGKRFVGYLTEHCPSAHTQNAFEVHLSPADTQYLAQQVGREYENR